MEWSRTRRRIIQAACGTLGAAVGGAPKGCCSGAKARVFLHAVSSDPPAAGRPEGAKYQYKAAWSKYASSSGNGEFAPRRGQ